MDKAWATPSAAKTEHYPIQKRSGPRAAPCRTSPFSFGGGQPAMVHGGPVGRAAARPQEEIEKGDVRSRGFEAVDAKYLRGRALQHVVVAAC